MSLKLTEKKRKEDIKREKTEEEKPDLLLRRHVLGNVNEATLPKHARPQLHAHDTEDEEDEETQQKDVPQHGQRV